MSHFTPPSILKRGTYSSPECSVAFWQLKLVLLGSLHDMLDNPVDEDEFDEL